MNKVTKLLSLEEQAKELIKRAKGRYVKVEDKETIKIDLAIASWLDRTKEAILKNPRNFKGYVKEYEELLIGFHNTLEYIEHSYNYKLGYVYRMIENELIRIEYISERDLVIEIG